MTTYNFDREIDRKKTNSLKYDFAVERGRDVDVLPLWVADMDFQAPKPVLDALQNAVSHGIFGYSEVGLSGGADSTLDSKCSSSFLRMLQILGILSKIFR